MKKTTVMGGIALVAFVCLLGSNISAEEFISFGPRSQGMGGAGVGVGDGATAHYYNPAAMTKDKKVGGYLTVGTTASAEGDVIQSVDQIAKSMEGTDWDSIFTKIDSGQPLSPSDVSSLMGLFVRDMTGLNAKGQGLLFNLNGGATVTVGDIAIFGNFFTFAGADPIFDISGLAFNSAIDVTTQISNTVGAGADHTGGAQPFTNPGSQSLADAIVGMGLGFTQNQAEELIYQAEQGGVDTSDPLIQQTITSIAQATGGSTTSTTASGNQSGLTFSGIMLKEFGVTYARPMVGEMVTVGANLKLMEGQTYYNFVKYEDMQSGSNTADNIISKDNLKSSTTFGIDLGAMVKAPALPIQGGLVIKNANAPKFAFAGPGDFKLDPQVRLGGAAYLEVPVLGKMTVAADYDVTKNKTNTLNGYESQIFAMGVELSIIALQIRTGMYQNLASDVSKAPVLTGGLGLGLLGVQLDLAGAMATKKAKIGVPPDDQQIPERFSVNFSLTARF
ncbi:MAG: conjugal transfer protein TraF [Planctomycetes bacterium]|nr:conjugal transfer protein TraF [Planctomycetota bacterium]